MFGGTCGFSIFGCRADSRMVEARVGRRRWKLCILSPLCLMWLIWGEQNSMYCDWVERPLFMLKSLFLSSLRSWESRECNPTVDQFLNIVDILRV